MLIVGVGAQVKITANIDSVSDKLNNSVKNFVNAVLDKSSCIGVRGEFTKKYLLTLGFTDENIKIIGCPSLYLYGNDLEITSGKKLLDQHSNIAMNVTPSVVKAAGLIDSSVKSYPNLEYIAQEHTDLAMMIWGEERGNPKDSRIPIHLNHDLYKQNKMRFFVDSIPWINYLKDKEFSFGSRIHGNIAAILARIPAVVIVHDSRTKELVNYHKIPYFDISSSNENTTVQDLYDLADYSEFNLHHPLNFRTYLDFLNSNNVDHIFKEEYVDYEKKFNEKLNNLDYPSVVEVSRFGENTIDDIFTKLRWLRQGMQGDKNRKYAGAYVPSFLEEWSK